MSEVSIAERFGHARLPQALVAGLLGTAAVLSTAGCNSSNDYVSADHRQVDASFDASRQEAHRRDVLGREADRSKKQTDLPAIQVVAIGTKSSQWKQSIAGSTLSGLFKTARRDFSYDKDARSWNWDNGSQNAARGRGILRAEYTVDKAYGDQLTIYRRRIISEGGRRAIVSCEASFQGVLGLTKAPNTSSPKIWYDWLQADGRKQLLTERLDCTEVPLSNSGERLSGGVETEGLTVYYDDAPKGRRPHVSSYAVRGVSTGVRDNIASVTKFLDDLNNRIVTTS